MTTMTIGKVARAAGLGVQTVRFYERQGLIATPARSGAGYRLYTPDTIQRLLFIARARALGFTLLEIAELLALQKAPDVHCADIEARANAKIVNIDHRIAQLEAMRRALDELVSQCRGAGPSHGCPILDALQQDPP